MQALWPRRSSTSGGIDVVGEQRRASAAPPTLAEMTDEQWSKVIDVTLTGTMRCMRAALRADDRAGFGGDRQQRLGARLAGPGRPVPLRRGQGRRDGAHPLRGDRGRAGRRPHQRRRAEPGHAPVPRQGHHATSCWPS